MSPSASVSDLRTDPRVVGQALAVATLGLRALSERALQWPALLLVSAAWGAALFVAEPTPARLIGCAGYSVVVYVLAYYAPSAVSPSDAGGAAS
jgi:hypothetical protein